MGKLRWKILLVLTALCEVAVLGCHGGRTIRRDPSTVVFLIESSPNSLDPRVGTDGQSEHIDQLIFDGLVARDAHYQFSPALAERWEQPDPLTLIFHLRHGIRFQGGQLLTSQDVLWTLNSMRNGAILTPKAASYDSISTIDAPDPFTVRIHLKQPDNFLLGNLSSSAMGIVPAGSGADFWRHPVGTGPFRFVSQETDKEVVLERNSYSWTGISAPDSVRRIRFQVVPDAITQALELRKGSADVASNSLPIDALPVLAQQENLAIEEIGGTQVQYLAFNTQDTILGNRLVRQAIAFSVDRSLIVKTLLGGRAQLADSLLPRQHWAYTDDVSHYAYNPKFASQLLDQAGYPPGKDGIRLHLTMKTSTDEGTRQLAATLQQQLAQIGIALDIRSLETATFLQDISRGAFQIYSLRWVGGNEQPDIFSYAFSSTRIPPRGANRGRYKNAHLDDLLQDAERSSSQPRRRDDYAAVQQILSRDLPAYSLWYRDSILVHNKRIQEVQPTPSGDFSFLLSAKIVNRNSIP
uniref:ABC peptide transporter, periplasmic ligand binding protein n=1 Tax=mine drainage metagenome TaxID=410659 RepID=E6QM96_9ZZZZ